MSAFVDRHAWDDLLLGLSRVQQPACGIAVTVCANRPARRRYGKMETETELQVLKDIRSLLHDLTLVFINYVPDNQRKLELHNAIQDLTEKLFNSKKTDGGMADSTATVDYQGHQLS
jgi:hypothetical protein